MTPMPPIFSPWTPIWALFMHFPFWARAGPAASPARNWNDGYLLPGGKNLVDLRPKGSQTQQYTLHHIEFSYKHVFARMLVHRPLNPFLWSKSTNIQSNYSSWKFRPDRQTHFQLSWKISNSVGNGSCFQRDSSWKLFVSNAYRVGNGKIPWRIPLETGSVSYWVGNFPTQLEMSFVATQSCHFFHIWL